MKRKTDINIIILLIFISGLIGLLIFKSITDFIMKPFKKNG
jgi:hypothetical protein